MSSGVSYMFLIRRGKTNDEKLDEFFGNLMSFVSRANSWIMLFSSTLLQRDWPAQQLVRLSRSFGCPGHV